MSSCLRPSIELRLLPGSATYPLHSTLESVEAIKSAPVWRFDSSKTTCCYASNKACCCQQVHHTSSAGHSSLLGRQQSYLVPKCWLHYISSLLTQNTNTFIQIYFMHDQEHGRYLQDCFTLQLMILHFQIQPVKARNVQQKVTERAKDFQLAPVEYQAGSRFF